MTETGTQKQKPTQFCEAIILQLKVNIFFLKKAGIQAEGLEGQENLS